MKKLLLTFVAILSLCTITAFFTACENTHTHTFSKDWSKDETHHWHAASCTHSDQVSDKAEHTWDEGETTKAATCLAEGEITYTCTVCGQTKVEATEEKGDHVYSEEWSKDENGHYHACTTAGCEEKSNVIEHVYGDPVIVDPALNEEGSKTYTCADCGYEKVETIPSLAIAITEDGTYTAEAEEAYHNGKRIDAQSQDGSLGWEVPTYGTASGDKSLAGLATIKGESIEFYVSADQDRTVEMLIYSNALDGNDYAFEKRFILSVNGEDVTIGNFDGVAWNGQNTYFEFSKGISVEISLTEGVNVISFKVVGDCGDHLLNFDCIKLVATAHEHAYGDPVVVEPQVGVEGSKTYTCGCGDVKTEAIPALAAAITEANTYVCEAEEAYLDGKKIEGQSASGSLGWESVSAEKISSNGKCLAGLARVKGQKIQFFVSSDEARTVKLMIYSNDIDGGSVAFEKRFILTVNGEAVTIGNFAGQAWRGEVYHEFGTGIETQISLSEGINEIFFEVVGDCGDHLLNFDCIKIIVE